VRDFILEYIKEIEGINQGSLKITSERKEIDGKSRYC
jgi:hypothetical protein